MLRWLGRLLLGLGLLLVIIAAGLTALLTTTAGRGLVLDVTLNQVNPIIPGTIEVKRLGWLSLSKIELWGVVIRDPEGTVVARAGHVAAYPDLPGLLAGKIAVRRGIVDDVWGDLRVFHPRRGFLAAFVDPDTPPSPPSPGPPPDVVIRSARITSLVARLPDQDPVGQLDAHVDELISDFSLIAGEPGASVQRLKLRATRDHDLLLDATATGRLGRGKQSTQLALTARTGAASVKLNAEMVLPLVSTWREQPASCHLEVRDLSAGHLAHVLRDPALASAFLGHLSLKIAATGTPQTAQATGVLTTAGGTLQFEELSMDGARLRARLKTEGIDLKQVRTDLPPHRLGLLLQVETVGLPPEPMHATLSLRQATVDSEPLLDLDAQGTWTQQRVEGIKLEGRAENSRVSAEGNWNPAGKSQLRALVDVRQPLVARLGKLVDQSFGGRVLATADLSRQADGELRAQSALTVDDFVFTPRQTDAKAPPAPLEVSHLTAQLSAHGQPQALKFAVTTDIASTRYDKYRLDQAQLSASGDLNHIAAQLHAQGGLGDPPAGRARDPKNAAELNLKLSVTRTEQATHLVADAHGQLATHPLVLKAQPTALLAGGGLTTQGILLDIGGERLTVQGSLRAHGTAGALTAQIGPLHLQKFARWTKDETLVGEVGATIRAQGSVAVPIVSVEVHGQGVGRLERPLLDFDARGHFDAREGKSDLHLNAASTDLLRTELDAAWEFRGGPRFADSLPRGHGQATLRLHRLKTALIDAYIAPQALPLEALARAEIEVSGSLADPAVDSNITVKARDESPRPVTVVHQLKYARGEAQTKLVVSDVAGRWGDFTGHMALKGSQPPTAEQLVALLRHAASDASWQAELKLARRRIDAIPFIELAVDRAQLPKLLSAMHVTVTHEPQQEPVALAKLLLEQDPSAEIAGCHSKTLTVSAQLQHESSLNQLVVRALDEGRELLRLESSVDYPIAPLLSGKSATLGPVDAELRTAQLALETLPFVCSHANGRVNLQASARDVLSKTPHITLDLKGKRLSLGSRDHLDLHLRSEANHSQVSADLRLSGLERYKDSRAHIRAQVLWTLGGGKLVLSPNAGLDARIDFKDFPVAPLLPPQSPVSYASGTIDANITAKGQLISPLVQGTLDLNRLSFTTNALAQPLSNVSGHFQFNGRRAQLTKFEAHDQKGKLELSGEVDLSNMARVTSQLRIKADDFPLRQRGQVAATTTMDLTAKAIITPDQTEVRLVFADVDTWLETVALRLGIPLKAHDEFIVDGRTPARAKKAREKALTEAAKAQGVQVDSLPDTEPEVLIFIDAQQRFWVKRKDFAVKLKAELEARIEDPAVRVLGDVMIDRGYLQLFGKVFDLRRESSVRFTGGNPPDPVLQLDADYKTRGGKIVAVSIGGRASAPVLTFSIDGNQVDAGIAVQELFGGEKGSGSSDATSQAQNFVSGLTAGILATAARRELGAAAPIIMIDPSEKSGEGRVRAGFELDTLVPPFLRSIVTGAYLEGVAARESQGNSNPSAQFGALLELYFPKNFFTAGQYGPGTTWSLDFGWQL